MRIYTPEVLILSERVLEGVLKQLSFDYVLAVNPRGLAEGMAIFLGWQKPFQGAKYHDSVPFHRNLVCEYIEQ
ncbi:hypothetical protein Scep_019554 [Stephania cephalantha]|uniref:Uncharacterized protein n=1 Tax=Stephania cephalantha TaxID=152367 RepID=A0AAP0IBE2_9MAGN